MIFENLLCLTMNTNWNCFLFSVSNFERNNFFGVFQIPEKSEIQLQVEFRNFMAKGVCIRNSNPGKKKKEVTPNAPLVS